MHSVRILSSTLPAHRHQLIQLEGWVHRIRDFGGVRFLILRDRSGLAQIVVPREIELSAIGCETVVRVLGTCREEPRAPGGVEVGAESLEVLSPAKPPPIELFHPDAGAKHRFETLLEHRAVSLRIPQVLEIFRVQGEIVRAFRAYLQAQEFTEIFTPKLVSAGAEGGSAVFRVDYFDRTVYLAQSPQFYKQMMVGSGLERVFEVGHAYRAEKSETSRHLTEYVSLDFEMGFIESAQDVMAMHAGLIRAIFEHLRDTCGTMLKARSVTLPDFEQIPQISFPEARDILARRFGRTLGTEAGDLDTESERLISRWAQEELGSELLFVTGYHVDVRPMYTMPNHEHPPQTCSFDLLFRGLEITTGGQRIHGYQELVESMMTCGLASEAYEDYLATFRHGMPPHGGMGMGLERLTKQILGLENVKEASLFPRDRYRVTP